MTSFPPNFTEKIKKKTAYSSYKCEFILLSIEVFLIESLIKYYNFKAFHNVYKFKRMHAAFCLVNRPNTKWLLLA